MPPLLELSNVTVVRGARRVLEDVTLTIPRGESSAVPGPHGAGQSPLLPTLHGE